MDTGHWSVSIALRQGTQYTCRQLLSVRSPLTTPHTVQAASRLRYGFMAAASAVLLCNPCGCPCPCGCCPCPSPWPGRTCPPWLGFSTRDTTRCTSLSLSGLWSKYSSKLAASWYSASSRRLAIWGSFSCQSTVALGRRVFSSLIISSTMPARSSMCPWLCHSMVLNLFPAKEPAGCPRPCWFCPCWFCWCCGMLYCCML
mmetsp:Transcript_8440/g.18537  ORF Transcript_8440/g.18537 Transcript_8440/m.18537 type:complete len:200 (-) Transcript_8440:1796-2395(-)